MASGENEGRAVRWKAALPPGGASRGKKRVVLRLGKAKAVGPFSPVRPPRPFRHAIFASEAEYDRSVESVVARILSGQVPARTPDE